MLAAWLSALDFCYVTTTGRTSGGAHRVEIWFAVHPERDTIYMLSGGRERAGWRATSLPVAIDLTPSDA